MGAKIRQFLKMSWMFSWRVLAITAIVRGQIASWEFILMAVAAAAVMAFVLNRAVEIWPLFKLVARRRLPIVKANGDGYEEVETLIPVKVSKLERPRIPTVQTATTNGRMTGFEPASLNPLPLPAHHNMTGVPGDGLLSATNLDEINIALGVQGEENFAKAIAKVCDIGDYRSVWSVPVPDSKKFAPSAYETDIDCVLVTENVMFLIDLKFYKSGGVTYTHEGNQLYCTDNATGSHVGDAKTMSRNMEMATSAVKAHFSGFNVIPVIVFMPTDKGAGNIVRVEWPGEIPAMNLTEFLEILSKQSGFVEGSELSRAATKIGLLRKMAPLPE